jgi:hypothetical protein
MPEARDQPINVTAEDGEIILEAAGFIVSLTPEAAEETSERIYQCAALARGQRRVGEKHPNETLG